MNTKDLSPAFLTSLAGIFVGAILIGTTSTVASVFGWIILLAGLALNVFSALVSIQQLKGGPLPAMMRENPADETYDEEPATDSIETVEEPAADTEAQQVIEEPVEEHKIFRPRSPRPRTR